MDTISLDADIASADWTKTTWDLPPYMSKEFLELVPPEELDAFRQRPVYQAAVEAGLIHDDEWVADYVAEPSPPATDDAKPSAKRRHIHVHFK